MKKGYCPARGQHKGTIMRTIDMNSLKSLIVNHPANGLKVLKTPYVLVVKTTKGTTALYQSRHLQENASVNDHAFGVRISMETIFDIEISSNCHALAFVVCVHDADGNVTEKKLYSIGEKGSQDEYVTAFLAYEAEGGKAIYIINIIEEAGTKPIFTASVRYCKSSEKLLKTQLKMYLALSGLSGEDREKILNGGGILPPPLSDETEGDYDE